MKMARLGYVLPALAVLCSACGTEAVEGRSLEGPPAEQAIALAPTVVDSTVPIGSALVRFQKESGAAPEALTGGRESAESLLRELDRLLVTNDTSGFEHIALTRAEFAHLYYETSPVAQAPYELPPELMWFQLQQENRNGVFRLLREFGGRGLGEAALHCSSPATRQGENSIWAGCRVRMAADGAGVRLFGSLIERDGVFKILSYANDF